MGAVLIDGRARAAALRAAVATQVAAFAARVGRAPGLAVVLVGEDPASSVYVRSKGRTTAEAGMLGFEHRLPADTPEVDLLALVDRLNADVGVDGILVQLPLPPHMDADRVITRIDPDKDVAVELTGRTLEQIEGKLAEGRFTPADFDRLPETAKS